MSLGLAFVHGQGAFAAKESIDFGEGCQSLFLRHPVVRQCRDTCYLEAAIASLENELARKHGISVSVDRVSLMEDLLLARWNLYKQKILTSTDSLAETLGGDKHKAKKYFWRTRNGQVDLVSYGNFAFLEKFFYHYGITIREMKSQKDVYVEDREIARLVDDVQSLAYYAQVKIKDWDVIRADVLEATEKEIIDRLSMRRDPRLQAREKSTTHIIDPLGKLNLGLHYLSVAGGGISSDQAFSWIIKMLKLGKQPVLIYRHRRSSEMKESGKTIKLDVISGLKEQYYRKKGIEGAHFVSVEKYVPEEEAFLVRNSLGYKGDGYSGYMLITKRYLREKLNFVVVYSDSGS